MEAEEEWKEMKVGVDGTVTLARSRNGNMPLVAVVVERWRRGRIDK